VDDHVDSKDRMRLIELDAALARGIADAEAGRIRSVEDVRKEVARAIREIDLRSRRRPPKPRH
jgi:predicted transcriptional regulator